MWMCLLSVVLAEEPNTEAELASDAPRLEISFGSSLLFVEQAFVREGLPNQTEQRVVPVPSWLLLGEYMFTPRWSAAGMINVPLSTVRRISPAGEIYEEHSSAAVGLGPAFAPVNLPVFSQATFRPQLALLAGRTVNDLDQNVTFPLVVGRAVLVSPSGTSLYGGVAYAFQEETLAVIYGLGHRF